MSVADVVEELAVADWEALGAAPDQARASAALEGGKVLFLPRLPFALLPEEARFLTPGAADNSRKNVSLDPATGRLGGTAAAGDDAAALTAMLDRYGRQATRLLHRLLPGYAAALQRARTSFRPVEVEQRPQSVRHDDRRLHVDAFPTRPMHGRRILRVFSNVAPDGTMRQWNVGEPFPDFAAQFLPRLRPSLPGSAWLLERLGITKGRRSAYDRIMLRLHDAGKRDEHYQRSAPRTPLAFPPGSTWIVYTDQVLHAALAGRFAFEQTFHLPVAAMAHPEQAPLRVLERLTGRALV
ncbi:MAG: Kdo hydroxylase family protein [Alphaproteobacteria bacterium]|nr:Kdo hydroxylase family protein [Alphaproteobacteria bacterium]